MGTVGLTEAETDRRIRQRRTGSVSGKESGMKDMKFEFEQGEVWWGGTSANSRYPLGVSDRWTEDLITASTSPSNQAMPLYLSSHGRILWGKEPFRVTFGDGMIRTEGGEAELSRGGDTLREAFLSAQAAHFPCDGRELPEDFFRHPQLNTWMEFTYDVDQRCVMDFARQWLENGYEPGIFIIDGGWQKRYGTWAFDPARFPDPRGMVRQLHTMGFRVLLWIVPYVSADGPEYVRSLLPVPGSDPEAARHLYVRTDRGEVGIFSWWDGYSALLDMRDGYNRDFLNRQLTSLTEEVGIDGFKFDGGSVIGYSRASLKNGDLPPGVTPHALNLAWNEFGSACEWHEYKDTYGRGGRNTIQRLRDKWHRWDGDGLGALIPCAVNAGLMGYPFICPDMIGGGEWRIRHETDFRVDEELFVRMAQCSALFPMMQFSWAPWRALSPENARLCLEAARLREKLVSEILKVVRASRVTGEPVIRALEYECPRQGLEGVRDEFMVGRDLLVAPVVEKGAEARHVCFPAGRWRGADGRVYEGLTVHRVSAPLDTLPWFARV